MAKSNVAFVSVLAVVACASSAPTSVGDSGAHTGGASSGGAGASPASGGSAGAHATGGLGGAGTGSQPGTGGSAGAPACRTQGQSCGVTETCCGPLICAGTCMTGVSDRNLKHDIVPVESEHVLEAVSKLPIATWSYTTEPGDVRHIGPMAQDFKAAFHVGASDRLITQVDADGVALAAIQALNRQVELLQRENTRLSGEVAALRAEVRRSKH